MPSDKAALFGLVGNSELTGKVKGFNFIKRTVLVEIENNHFVEIELNKIKKSGVLNVIK